MAVLTSDGGCYPAYGCVALEAGVVDDADAHLVGRVGQQVVDDRALRTHVHFHQERQLVGAEQPVVHAVLDQLITVELALVRRLENIQNSQNSHTPPFLF